MPHVEIQVVDAVVDLLEEAYVDTSSEGVLLRVVENREFYEIQQLLAAAVNEFIVNEHVHLCVRETVKTQLDDGTYTETNPHYHCFFFIKKGRMGALRQRISRPGSPWHNNKGYSLKKNCTNLTPNHFNYLCKGKGTGSDDQPEVFSCSESLTDDLIRELNATFWLNKTKINANTKKRKLSASAEIHELCRHLDGKDAGDIFDIIIKYYANRIKYLNPAYLRNLVRQTQVYLDPDGKVALNLKDYCLGVWLHD